MRKYLTNILKILVDNQLFSEFEQIHQSTRIFHLVGHFTHILKAVHQEIKKISFQNNFSFFEEAILYLKFSKHLIST